MMTGRDLIGYAVNEMDGDKLTNLKTIVEELIGLDDITSRAISLINPYNQYGFLEEMILEIDDVDNKIKNLLKSYNIPVPLRYGWKHVSIYSDGHDVEQNREEWYDNEFDCYRAMYGSAMNLIGNAIDCLYESPITIISKGTEGITISSESCKDVFELYEM